MINAVRRGGVEGYVVYKTETKHYVMSQAKIIDQKLEFRVNL